MPILFSNAIGPVPVSIFEDEAHESTIEITEVPIETGASVTDHAYRNPNKVTIGVVSDSAVATYGALKALQQSRVPFTLVTGLHVYQNMLIKSLSPSRNAQFSAVFKGKVVLQEAIIVGSTYIGGQAGLTGFAGGNNSVSAAPMSAATTLGQAIQRRASSTIARGDNRTVAAVNTALLQAVA